MPRVAWEAIGVVISWLIIEPILIYCLKHYILHPTTMWDYLGITWMVAGILVFGLGVFMYLVNRFINSIP